MEGVRKIKTLFVIEYGAHRGSLVATDQVREDSEWVIEGQGQAFQKWDGTACMVRDGVLFKRYNRKRNRKTGKIKSKPANWEPCEEGPDEITGHWPGWVPVGDGPEDKWHREAGEGGLNDGTYELCGPKVQGNPEGLPYHVLMPHDHEPLDAPREFGPLRRFLAARDMEGVVWHHPDGRMVKMRTKDFGDTRRG